MQNQGKKFENAFKNSIPEGSYMVHRLHDPPQAFNQSDALRFSWKNPCDYFVFDDKNQILYTLELKSTKQKSMSFEDINIKEKQPSKMIHKHQILSLIELGKYANIISGFIFNFRDEKQGIERTYFQSIGDFMKMYYSLNKKSFNEIDLIQSGGYLKVVGTKKRVNYTWDIEGMFNELSAERFTKKEREWLKMNTVFDRKKGYYTTVDVEGTTEFTFNVNTSLSGKLSIINTTMNNLVDDENGVMRYHSIAKDIMFKYAVISELTDIDLSYIKEEQNKIDAIEYFVTNTNVFAILLANTGDLIPTLYKSLNEEITATTGVREDVNNIISSIGTLIDTTLLKVSQLDIDSISDAAKKLGGITGTVNENSIVNAFQQTDEYKRSQDEIIDSKNAEIRDLKSKITDNETDETTDTE